MSIEIYSKAVIVKKEDVYYYFLKHHSKNDCVCKYQVVADANFNNHYLKRDGRGGSWSVKAHGFENTVMNDVIAETSYNAPTSYMYGQIQFGNKKNIALYWAKQGQKGKFLDYSTLDETQKKNIDGFIEYYMKKDADTVLLDLNKPIPENKRMETEHKHWGDNAFLLKDHCVRFNGRDYWNLDNL